jgi:hypothetical protein
MCDMCKPRVLTVEIIKIEITVPKGAPIEKRALLYREFPAACAKLMQDREQEFWNFVLETNAFSDANGLGWSRETVNVVAVIAIRVYERAREDRSKAKRGCRLRPPEWLFSLADDMRQRGAPEEVIRFVFAAHYAGWREKDGAWRPRDPKGQLKKGRPRKSEIESLLDLATIVSGEITSDGHDGRKQRRRRAWKAVDAFCAEAATAPASAARKR